MKKVLYCLVCFLSFFPKSLTADGLCWNLKSDQLLSELACQQKPWEILEANSEQRQPFYIGSSPREMALRGAQETHPTLPSQAKPLLEKQAQLLLKNLNLTEGHFEVWPFLTDLGDPNWVVARYRTSDKTPWVWLEDKNWNSNKAKDILAPALPVLLNPSQNKDAQNLFADFMHFENLLQKPVYQEAIWTRKNSKELIAGWISPKDKNRILKLTADDSSIRARILPQPARFNSKPVTFVVHASLDKPLDWGKVQFNWLQESPFVNQKQETSAGLLFSKNYETQLKKDIEVLSGTEEAIYPISHRKNRFTHKSASLTNNQLLEVVDYLEERYQQLGIKTRRQTFSWRSINLANLIAEIPGRDRTLPPMLIADHYDTAIAEDHYAKNNERISTAGADDNGTGTATLLRAAEELKDKKPNRDIWILHLTGEEFPSDDLGIRYFMKGTLQEKKDIAGMVLVDMIGFKGAGNPVFQINSGKTKESLQLSELAMQIAKNMKGPYVPTFRNRWGEESYLYYTDGYILDSLGFPVVLFNEHLNRKTFGKLNPYYHQTTDLPEHIDYSYAAHISKIAITTLWNAAK